MNQLVFQGGFTPDDAEPTCEGFVHAWMQSQEMPRNELLRVSKMVMDAIWTQPLPPNDNYFPVMRSVADIVDALNNGWAYNANEGDNLYMVFADIRAIARNGNVVGVGTQSPDQAFIHDGRELVSWRDRRWAAMRGPEYLKERAAKHTLRLV